MKQTQNFKTWWADLCDICPLAADFPDFSYSLYATDHSIPEAEAAIESHVDAQMNWEQNHLGSREDEL